MATVLPRYSKGQLQSHLGYLKSSKLSCIEQLRIGYNCKITAKAATDINIYFIKGNTAIPFTLHRAECTYYSTTHKGRERKCGGEQLQFYII